MEKKMIKQMMMALLLAMMPFAASAQETPVVQEQADSLLSPSINGESTFLCQGFAFGCIEGKVYVSHQVWRKWQLDDFYDVSQLYYT